MSFLSRRKLAESESESDLLQMKRVEANDPVVALQQAGMHRFIAGDYATGIEYWEKAAGLGDIGPYYQLSSNHLSLSC